MMVTNTNSLSWGSKIALFLFYILVVSCNGENAPDCWQTSGKIISEEVSLPAFEKITVFENVELILSQGANQRVIVETGENLRPDITLEVVDNTLELRDANFCNLFRPYGQTKIHVTAPNISEIRSSTGFPVRSNGVLNYESLTLYSESFLNPETETTDGSFLLELDSRAVNIVVNGIAYFKLNGAAESLDIRIAAGDSRVEASGLITENVVINHRGTNDIQVFPVSSLEGVIRGTGDVESFNRPPMVMVETLYKGRLIFVD